MSLRKKPAVVAVIPARLNSERLPGKVLRILAGKAMLHHVYDAAQSCALLDALWVATDSDAVRLYCEARHIPVMMTSAAHRSGTERIGEVMERVHGDVFINLQADEPMLTEAHVRRLAEPFLDLSRARPENPAGEVQVSTLKTALDPAEAHNPNVVKVVTDCAGRALYFSRAAIPFRRDSAIALPYFKHLGVYGYRREALRRYAQLPATLLEQAERLEQLRFLENAMPIWVGEAEDTIGVDTEEDWRAVERRLATR